MFFASGGLHSLLSKVNLKLILLCSFMLQSLYYFVVDFYTLASGVILHHQMYLNVNKISVIDRFKK